ncbi:zinc finger protein 318 [Tachyglossus aculeatus]|uniref:zinc finger protein 318 n=1 Tax=Tachyglossus aculeatus TaxID=9261 RepID=UPI0018F3C1BF|nr:zinc finger protein 318 [Tachyglossus aculeatus]
MRALREPRIGGHVGAKRASTRGSPQTPASGGGAGAMYRSRGRSPGSTHRAKEGGGGSRSSSGGPGPGPGPPPAPRPRADYGRQDHRDGDGLSARRRSPGLHSNSPLDQSLRITVGNERFSASTSKRRRLNDLENLGDLDRDVLTDGPIYTRGLERYPSREERPLSPYPGRHNEDYRVADPYPPRSDYFGRSEELSRGSDRDGDKFKKGSYPPRAEDRGREVKRPRYDDGEKLPGLGGDLPGFGSGTRNYRRRSRSPSPRFLDPEFRELDLARRKREEEERTRNLGPPELVGVDSSGSSCAIPGLTGVPPGSEAGYPLHRPDEAPAMPKKSILKKRLEVDAEPPLQLESFRGGSTASSSQDLPLLSGHSSLPPSSARTFTTPFTAEVENFLKRFNKGALAETAPKEPPASLYKRGPFPGLPKDGGPLDGKSESFLTPKEKAEVKSEPAERGTDFLLPHERASQDGSGFSRILGMLADSAGAQEKRRRSFPNIEDEEKFLYGDEEEDDPKLESAPGSKASGDPGGEALRRKATPPPPSTPAAKVETPDETTMEYAKIHDLLKTIGLDIGVAEIGKLAVRTQERLHGKKPLSRSPDRRSSTDSRGLESREARRADPRSPEAVHPRPTSPADPFLLAQDSPPYLQPDRCKSQGLGPDVAGSGAHQPAGAPCLVPTVPTAPVRLPPATSAVAQFQLPAYSQFSTGQIAPAYQAPAIVPSTFDAYRHYMAYATTGWSVYPSAQQPSHSLPNPHRLLPIAMPGTSSRPNLRMIPTVASSEPKRDESLLMPIPTLPAVPKVPIPPLMKFNQPSGKFSTEKLSEEKNRAAQKQKVIEEREKLKTEREARQKKMHYLRTELDRLRKQQGEMLRKKRREKDGHKDPLLVEVNRLQDNIQKDISELRREAEAAEKKQSELDKVAQILGINIFDKPRRASSDSKEAAEKSGKVKNPEPLPSANKEPKANNEKPRPKSPKPPEPPAQPSPKPPVQSATIYEYYDAGNHWCKDCNTICGTMFDFFTHMHNKKHRQTLDPYSRPWASKMQNEAKQDPEKRADKITVPAKGSEFLVPITGYYCQLCEEFFGDQISGEQHVKCHQHNEKYKKYVDENPLYEARRNLDRQAGLAVVLETERRRQNELKRKLSEKPQQQEERKEEKEPNEANAPHEMETKETTEAKEDLKGLEELGEQAFEPKSSPEKVEIRRKMGLKLRDGKKELSSIFGKFTWKKQQERGEEEKAPGAAPSPTKEEVGDGGKDKEDGKIQAGKVKPIEIKLSGKTVIPHTSPWTPVTASSTQAKIRPNLPIPTMVLRKSGLATVSKPAPLNTFLSIKSSGTTAKPLPVVKESTADVLLPPDIISKAFGGEEVILKGSPEEAKKAEKSEPTPFSEQLPPPPPPPPPPLPFGTAQPVAIQSPPRPTSTLVLSKPTPCLPPTPSAQGPDATPPQSLPATVLPPLQPAPIPSDDVAPGVSESDRDQSLLSLLVRPPPPLSRVFGDQAKKVEKRNSCLAAANAKDLYDIFYSSSGKGAPESKLGPVTLANGDGAFPGKAESPEALPSSTPSGGFLAQGSPSATPSSESDPDFKPESGTAIGGPLRKGIGFGHRPGRRKMGGDSGCPSAHTGTDFLAASALAETIAPEAAAWALGPLEWEAHQEGGPKEDTGLSSGEPRLPGTEGPGPQPAAAPSPTPEHQGRGEPPVLALDEGRAGGSQGPQLAERQGQRKEGATSELLPGGEGEIQEGMEVEAPGTPLSLARNGLPRVEGSNWSHRDIQAGEGTVDPRELRTEDPAREQTEPSANPGPKKEAPGKVETEAHSVGACIPEERTDNPPPSAAGRGPQRPQGAGGQARAPESAVQRLLGPGTGPASNGPKEQAVSEGREFLSLEPGLPRVPKRRGPKPKRGRGRWGRTAGARRSEAPGNSSREQEDWEVSERREPEASGLSDHPRLESPPGVKVEPSEGLLGMGPKLPNANLGAPNKRPTGLPGETGQPPTGWDPPTADDTDTPAASLDFAFESPHTLTPDLGPAAGQGSPKLKAGQTTTPGVLKTKLELERVHLGLGDLEPGRKDLGLPAGGIPATATKGTARSGTVELRGVESSAPSSPALAPSVSQPEPISSVQRTSKVQEEKPRPFLAQPENSPEGGRLEPRAPSSFGEAALRLDEVKESTASPASLPTASLPGEERRKGDEAGQGSGEMSGQAGCPGDTTRSQIKLSDRD